MRLPCGEQAHWQPVWLSDAEIDGVMPGRIQQHVLGLGPQRLSTLCIVVEREGNRDRTDQWASGFLDCDVRKLDDRRHHGRRRSARSLRGKRKRQEQRQKSYCHTADAELHGRFPSIIGKSRISVPVKANTCCKSRQRELAIIYRFHALAIDEWPIWDGRTPSRFRR